MTQFTPKQLNENVNVSKTHPLTELLWLLGGLLLLVGGAFFLLTITANWAASKTPVKVENQLGHLALKQFSVKDSPALQKRLTTLLASMPQDAPLREYDFRIFLSETDEVNAFALPGGRIVVLRGLLRQVESENELIMVLAHELGHFAHRDHMRALGRGLGLAVASILFLGEDNAAGDLISKALLTFQAQYSQDQESAADEFGIDLLTAHYGHAGGATTFFSRLADKSGGKLPYILASHPHPDDRIEALQQRIKRRGYPVKAILPIGADIQRELQPTD